MSEIESWLQEGTAHRSPVRRTPVIHLLVQEAGEWRMWCSGGKGRVDNPHGDRLCRECRKLIADAIEAGDVDVRSAGRWTDLPVPVGQHGKDSTVTKIEPISRDELRSLLAEGVHTAFRKGGDGPQSDQIWRLIRQMPNEEWGAVITFLVDSFDVMGLTVCRATPEVSGGS